MELGVYHFLHTWIFFTDLKAIEPPTIEILWRLPHVVMKITLFPAPFPSLDKLLCRQKGLKIPGFQHVLVFQPAPKSHPGVHPESLEQKRPREFTVPINKAFTRGLGNLGLSQHI